MSKAKKRKPARAVSPSIHKSNADEKPKTALPHPSSSLSRLLLTGVAFSILWSLFFILTKIYLSRPNGLGEFELTAMHVFRSHLHRADFGAYTFDAGLGMSIYRLLPAGFGGIFTLPLSLLPEKIHPEALSLLNALRLAISGACFVPLMESCTAHAARSKQGVRAKIQTLLPTLAGLLYSVCAFVLCLVLHLPVADTFFLLPLLLLQLQKRAGHVDAHAAGHSEEPAAGQADAQVGEQADEQAALLSLPSLFLIAAFLCANAVWGLFLLPIPVLFVLVLCLRKSKRSPEAKRPIRRFVRECVGSMVAAFLLLLFLLLPQYMQFHYACGEGEPGAAFLARLGNDTDKYHTNLTWQCAATDILFARSPSLLVTAREQTAAEQADASDAAPSVTPEPSTEATYPLLWPENYSSEFEFFNAWVYTLWPSLPVEPFQTATYQVSPETSSTSQTYTLDTLFSSELFCAVSLPERQRPVSIYLNDQRITTITERQGTCVIRLGTYHVGQLLTLRLEGSSQQDLAHASVSFAYLNELNWSLYTGDVNFGVSNLSVKQDGITAEALVSSGSMLLTNIPYEDGWSLYYGGQKVAVRAYQDAFLCADIPAGNQVVHLRYVAPGSTLGGWISGLSFLALAVYCTWGSRKKKAASSSETAS